ncbi:hypothetical protein LIN78_02925 [Leeia sp. TBRC 13508]|uniref:Uncharacterized protein n=1 Tax=Leeia speluncae TaxID=2884804 RepID=A0ABS8D2W2_9NEIS|nr:hypothetical protein [Leeia speluncae]MCB6182502.1 hypothetical protein [Leeia speluncae]
MKKSIFFSTLLCSSLLLSYSVGAEEFAEANATDIQMLLKAASGTNTANWATLIGETRTRVYIEYATGVHTGSFWSNQPSYTVYWIPRANLSDAQLASFQSFKDKLNPLPDGTTASAKPAQ